MGCVNVKGIKKGKGRKFPGLHDPRILASETICMLIKLSLIFVYISKIIWVTFATVFNSFGFF
jgi:hypothetical protein